MEDSSVLIWGTLLGGLGIGYFIYGRRQKKPVSFFTGISLFAIPYFIDDVILLIAVALVLMILPFVVKL